MPPSNPPRCGNETEKDPTHETWHCKVGAEPCPGCVELAEIDDDTAQGKALELLLERRERAKQKINYHHDPFIHRLPPEVASRVFDFCIPPRPAVRVFEDDNWRWWSGEYPQFALGSVCRYWRQILWSDPTFWDDLSVGMRPDSPISRTIIIKEWLERSCQLPLFLGLHSQQGRNNTHNTPHFRNLIQALATVINPHLHRCQLIQFCLWPQLGSLLHYHGHSSSLEGLVLSPLIDRDYTNASFRINPIPPKPTYLRCIGYNIDNIGIIWENLTHIFVENLDPEATSRVLRHSPQLLKCTIDRGRHSSADHRGTVTHSRLQHLQLSSPEPNALVGLILPALMTLEIDLRFESLIPIGSIYELIRRSGCTLTTLILRHAQETEENALQLLQGVPSLTNLEWGSPLSSIFFEHFRETMYSKDGAPGSFLPNLRYFKYNSDCSLLLWSSLHSMVPIRPPPPGDMRRRPLSSVVFWLELDPDLECETEEEAIVSTMISFEDLYFLLEVIESGVVDKFEVITANDVDLIEVWKKHHGLLGVQ